MHCRKASTVWSKHNQAARFAPHHFVECKPWMGRIGVHIESMSSKIHFSRAHNESEFQSEMHAMNDGGKKRKVKQTSLFLWMITRLTSDLDERGATRKRKSCWRSQVKELSIQFNVERGATKSNLGFTGSAWATMSRGFVEPLLVDQWGHK